MTGIRKMATWCITELFDFNQLLQFCIYTPSNLIGPIFIRAGSKCQHVSYSFPQIKFKDFSRTSEGQIPMF